MFRAVFLTGIHLLLFDMIHMKIRQNGISILLVKLGREDPLLLDAVKKFRNGMTLGDCYII